MGRSLQYCVIYLNMKKPPKRLEESFEDSRFARPCCFPVFLDAFVFFAERVVTCPAKETFNKEMCCCNDSEQLHDRKRDIEKLAHYACVHQVELSTNTNGKYKQRDEEIPSLKTTMLSELIKANQEFVFVHTRLQWKDLLLFKRETYVLSKKRRRQTGIVPVLPPRVVGF
jgi:hypothetical protein